MVVDAITTFARIFAEGMVKLMGDYSFVVIMLAIFGLLSVVSAIGDKIFKCFNYLFLIFIAMPLIIIVGLLDKKHRKERLKELGDIKAHLKSKPEKWKRIVYVTLICIFVLLLSFAIYKFLSIYILPISSMNEAVANLSRGNI